MKQQTRTILAIDSAVGGCQVLLWRGQDDESGCCLGYYACPHAPDQATTLPLVIADLINTEKNLHLDHIVVTIGPGSFTGIRIGLAAARGLGLALDIPVIGISSLTALALSIRLIDPEEIVIAVIPASQDRLFAQAFGGDRAPLWPEPSLTTADEIVLWLKSRGSEPVLLVGTAAKTLELPLIKADITLRQDISYPDLRAITYHSITLNPVRNPARPLYIHPPVAKSGTISHELS